MRLDCRIRSRGVVKSRAHGIGAGGRKNDGVEETSFRLFQCDVEDGVVEYILLPSDEVGGRGTEMCVHHRFVTESVKDWSLRCIIEEQHDVGCVIRGRRNIDDGVWRRIFGVDAETETVMSLLPDERYVVAVGERDYRMVVKYDL